jgi:diguanylate cyclase (GGDEF)-like protein
MGIQKSLHEFSVEEHFSIDDISPFSTLREGYYDDAWYFTCVASEKDYLLNVDIDKIYNRKHVWLNYKVTRDDNVYGVLSTWLGFSGLVERLFSQYDSGRVRGLVIDEHGTIHMDSALLGDDNFLHYTTGNERRIEDEFTDAAFLSAINGHLEEITGYFDLDSAIRVIELSNGKYRYVTIAPIVSTTWSVVTFYDASSLFGTDRLLPLFVIVLVMLIIFVIATGYMGSKFIIEPVEKLTVSIMRIKANIHEKVYGTDRRDEIGEIAQTVQDMKDNLIDALDKVHYDALTGIYNRRYLQENLSRTVHSLLRSGGTLSVMMLDVDFFKKFNDTYGHDIGDTCLKKIATTLAGSLGRADDFVARYGGEEFAVILPNIGEAGARILANKLLENVIACRIPHSNSNAADYVTISIGVTSGAVVSGSCGEQFIKRADEALYISKHSGRNRYSYLHYGEN